MNLYEIENTMLECVDQETGEILDMEMLDKLQMDRDTKIENIGLWYKNLLAEAEAIKVEKNRLAERQKVAENKAEQLKRYLDSYLAGNTFKTAVLIISYRKSTSVAIENTDAIPEEFLKYAEPAIDKMAIGKALKDEVSVPGATLVSRFNIQIK